MTLFLISTHGLGDFYVVEKDPTAAIEKLKNALDHSKYGVSADRNVNNIRIISEEITYFPDDKRNFSSGNIFLL